MDSKELIIIRQAVPDNAEILQEYLTKLSAEKLLVIFRQDHVPTVEEEHVFISELRKTARSLLILALVNDEIIGMLDFHASTRPQCQHVGKLGISVTHAWRRRKVATKLMEYLFNWARPAGIKRIELEVFENNTDAISLYQHLGFIIEGKKKDAVEVHGKYIDIMQMAKLLN